MLLLGLPFVYGLAFGAIAAVLAGHGRRADAAPAAARLHRPRHRPPRTCRTCSAAAGALAVQTLWWRWSRVVQRHPWIAGAAAARHPRRAGVAAVRHAPGVHRRRQRPDQPDDPPGLRPAGRRLRAGHQRAARRRRRRPRRPRDRAVGRRAAPPAASRRPAWPSPSRPRSTRPATPPSSSSSRPPPRRTSAPSRSCTASATRSSRPSTRGTGVQVLVGGETAAAVDSAADFVAPAALGHRRRGHPVVPAAHGRVPVPRRAAQGRGHEPAVGRRRLRRDRRRVPVGLARLGRRDRQDRADRPVDTADAVHHPVRPVDGLRGVPPVPDPGGVASHATTTPPRSPTGSQPPPG